MMYSIGEFARLINVHVNTLRRWEKEEKLIPSHRTKGNQRVYTSEQVEEYLQNKKNKEEH